jgi:ubiquinone/menaquinone biosynthesis C-methylase UbiE
VVEADVEAIPVRSSSFDFVLCIEVLRYLPSPSTCLREMARVLRPGGVCLATATPVLNLNGYWLVNRLASVVPIPGCVRLRQFFSRSAELRREFREAGFGPLEVHGVYFGPVNWLERLAPRAVAPALRRWERADAALADRPILRELSNMFLVRATRERTGG